MSGYTVGMVLDLFLVNLLPVGTNQEVIVGHYVAASSSGLTLLTFRNDLGDPPILMTVFAWVPGLSDFFNLVVSGIDGSVQILSGPDFIRGDCNGDLDVDSLADGVFLLSAFFVAGAPPPPCNDACDANDDGNLDPLSDAIFLFTFGFLGGMAPPPPFPDCGADPSRDTLDCSVACP